ncbi:transposase [Actinoplanes tereljensis]|nr:transposase [Actinoplanes tereljensis]
MTDEQWEIIEPMLPLIKEPRPDPEASVARHRKIAVADVCSG